MTSCYFPTKRQNNNFIDDDTTWVHNSITEGVILKYFKDEKRIWVKAKRAILCLWNQLFLFHVETEPTEKETSLFSPCEQFARILGLSPIVSHQNCCIPLALNISMIWKWEENVWDFMATTGPRWAGLRGNPHSWCVVCTMQAWECSSWSKIEPWACFIYPDHLNHYLFLSVAVFYRLRRSLFAQLTALPFVLSCFSYIHMKCFGSSRVHRVQRLVLQKNICISLVFKRKVNKIKQDEKSWGEMLAPP